MTEVPGPPPQKEYFEPSELSLDLSKEGDLDIYVRSNGDRQLAELLIDRKAIVDAHNAGTLDDAAYEAYVVATDQAIDQRHQQLYGPQ